MRITVFVKPGSKKGPLVETSEQDEITVYLKERTVDGMANEGLIALLAKHFEVRKSDVTIESGFTSKIKRVFIER